jgi:hypothetical protein
MKNIALALVAAAALAGAGMAISSGGPNEKLASQSRAYGGGQFSPFNGAVTRAFALDAHVDGSGNGAAYGTWEYGPPTGPWHVRGDITCMNVVGNVAIVGGWVRETERPELAVAFLTYVRDNGTPASGAQDEASVSYFGGTSGANGDFPTSFPQTCPAGTDSFTDEPPIWFPVTGDVVVQQ